VDDGGNSACSTWFDSRTALLNSSSSAVSHSSSNVGVFVEQHPRRPPGAVYHCVDALAIRRLGETAPCAGGVRQTSDDVSAVCRRAAEPHCSVGGSATLAGPDCALHCICIVRLAERWREHVVVSRTKQVRARAFINTVLGCFVSLHRCQG